MTEASDDELMTPDVGHDRDDEARDDEGRDDGARDDDDRDAEVRDDDRGAGEHDEHDDEHAGARDAIEISELEIVTQERDQFKELAMRLQADFENYRKRAAAQSADDVDRATGRMAEALLPVLDAAEAAYVSHPDEVGPLLNAMLTELKKLGLETLDLEGERFDPSVAEAVSHEPDDGSEVVVAEVMRSGYRWKGRTLRPAMVRTRG